MSRQRAIHSFQLSRFATRYGRNESVEVHLSTLYVNWNGETSIHKCWPFPCSFTSLWRSRFPSGRPTPRETPAKVNEVSKMAVRVMIVDDSIAIRDILRLDLESIGCQIVAEADNATQALSLFRAVRPDAVTLDVLMPQAGGLDSLGFFRILRKEAPEVPVIVVSVVSDPEIREKFIDEGSLEYIVKPFNHRTFQQLRTRLLERFPTMASSNPGTGARARSRS